MILYFLRHGLAGLREEWHDDDSRRPLTKKGIKNMERQGKTIARLALRLDKIITSPLTRAVQTADIVARELNMDKQLKQDKRLAPGFGGDNLQQVLADHPDATNLMLVGHEPDFSLTISALTGGSNVILKKGGLARVDISASNPMRGDLLWLLPPKIMLL